MSSHNICLCADFFLSSIVFGFNDTSTLVRHFVSPPREREKKVVFCQNLEIVEEINK